MEYIIASKKEYHETMILIYDLMNKSEVNLTRSDTEKLASMTAATEKFEDEVLASPQGFLGRQPDSHR